MKRIEQLTEAAITLEQGIEILAWRERNGAAESGITDSLRRVAVGLRQEATEIYLGALEPGIGLALPRIIFGPESKLWRREEIFRLAMKYEVSPGVPRSARIANRKGRGLPSTLLRALSISNEVRWICGLARSIVPDK